MKLLKSCHRYFHQQEEAKTKSKCFAILSTLGEKKEIIVGYLTCCESECKRSCSLHLLEKVTCLSLTA